MPRIDATATFLVHELAQDAIARCPIGAELRKVLGSASCGACGCARQPSSVGIVNRTNASRGRAEP